MNGKSMTTQEMEREAEALFISNKLKKAEPLLETLAQRRSPRGTYLLSCICESRSWAEAGDDDREEAVELLEMAGAAGDVIASIEYLRTFESDMSAYEARINKLVPKLRDLAESGDVIAQEYFASLLLDVNVSEGVKWLKKAADAGYWLAIEELAEILYFGIDSEPDYPEAIEYLKKGVALESARCNLYMGYCSYMGHEVLKDYGTAMNYFKRAYKTGPRGTAGEAAYLMGIMYKNGQGATEDDKIAAGWIELAADAGYEPAFYELASCYFTGRGVEQDLDRAMELLTKSAEKGDEKARVALGSLLSLQRGN